MPGRDRSGAGSIPMIRNARPAPAATTGGPAPPGEVPPSFRCDAMRRGVDEGDRGTRMAGSVHPWRIMKLAVRPGGTWMVLEVPHSSMTPDPVAFSLNTLDPELPTIMSKPVPALNVLL